MSNPNDIRLQIAKLVKEFAELKFKEKKFKAGRTVIPASGKVIGNKEVQYMVDAALDGWLTSGRFNRKFEKELASFIGIKHLVTTNSGSSANLLAFMSLTSEKLGSKAIKKGDEVITVAAGFPTTVNPIVQFGAIPVFVDVDIKTHNINTDLIEAALTSKTKAIMIAHTLGNPFDLIRVKEICAKFDLWLVEDCCDALGARFDDFHVGTLGDIATCSFYPAHHITMGEGGAVFTSSDKLISIVESLRDWGRDCYCDPGCDNTCGKRFDQSHGELPFGYDHKYVYSHKGYNLKITDMQAACGLAQLEKLPSFIKKRNQNFEYLQKKLGHLNHFFDLAKSLPRSSPSWFGFPITLKENINRLDFINYLDRNRIGSRLLFAGNLIKQPYFKNIKYRVSGELINTDLTMKQTLWIGIYPAIKKEHLDYIVDKIEFFFQHEV